MQRLLALGLLAFVTTACADNGIGLPSETPPDPPATNDPAFTIERVNGWYLVGDDVTPGQDALNIDVTAPDGVEYVDVWVAGAPGIRLPFDGTNFFSGTIDISGLSHGEHEILLAAEGSTSAFARLAFKRSAPVYVIVTTDWDDPDTTDEALSFQDDLHDEHPHLKLTHFLGPYTFTDPTLTTQRVTLLTDWLKGHRDTYDDEVGLHIHPYCHFVEYAGVTCIIAPSFSNPVADNTGYSVPVWVYDEAEFTTLLDAADDLFIANGFAKPTSFRAGGWSAVLSTIKALENAGYVADTSANNWARLEEWMGSGTLYSWNMENWSSIGDTSQPYYPSETDILVPGEPSIGVLEVPDNGILVDYVETAEMIEIFDANWDGSILTEPVQVSIGYHPSNFVMERYQRMTEIMTYIDQYLAVDGNGPAVYATLSDMARVWKRN